MPANARLKGSRRTQPSLARLSGLVSPKKRLAPALTRASSSITSSSGTQGQDAAVTEARIVSVGLAVSAADFTGLDILSGVDYLKALQSSTTMPPYTSRERRADILARRRDMPAVVLAHMLSSLLPGMVSLERELSEVVRRGALVALPLADGETALVRIDDYDAPAALREVLATSGGQLEELQPDAQRELAASGHLLRGRDGTLAASAPNIGLYLGSLRLCRRWILNSLRRAGGIALEATLRLRYEAWKEGVFFAWKTLMHDIVGSGRAEVVQLTTGPGLRITRRGRLEKT